MDLNADSGKLPVKTMTEGQDLDHELSFSYTETDSGIISLQLLEFKTSLLEAVEELHIRRDAETRYEEQISQLVLEKQELEWQKESLQHQIDTNTNQHTESLSCVKKQFQAKIRGVEGEKGKQQLTAELKDKEINSLKEELKLLQLFKYSLEKKLSELEQKLQLQSQTKDSHLRQLGEVENRFAALSRQCAVVKQGHEELEQNVENAMRLNKKLTSVNRRQESNITSLKQELEEVNSKLIKARVSSLGRCEESSNQALKEQHVQQLQHRLHVEMEINKKLRDENATERAEKQEMRKSLQHAQQLLQAQMQTVSCMGLELQGQRTENQALKREHEVMQEEARERGDRFHRLLEEYQNSRMIWDNERMTFQERIHSEKQDLRSMKEAYDHLHEKHTELCSHAIHQAEHIHGLEIGLKDFDKDTQNQVSETRGISTEEDLVLKDLREDPVVWDQHTESNSRVGNIGVSDRISDVIPDTATVSDVSPQTAPCGVISYTQAASHVYNPDYTDPEGAGRDQDHGEGDPSSGLLPRGSLEGLAPVQAGDGRDQDHGEGDPSSGLLPRGSLEGLAPVQAGDGRDQDHGEGDPSSGLLPRGSLEGLAPVQAGDGRDQDHGEGDPSSGLLPRGSLEGLAPVQAGDGLVVNTLLVDEDVLSICGEGRGQPDDSNNKPSSNSNPSLDENENDPAVCGLIDNVCAPSPSGVSDVLLSDQGGCVPSAGLSGPENSSVYGAGDRGGDPVAEGRRDENGEREEEIVCIPEVRQSQTCDDKHRGSQGSTASSQDVDLVVEAEASSNPCTLTQRLVEHHGTPRKRHMRDQNGEKTLADDSSHPCGLLQRVTDDKGIGRHTDEGSVVSILTSESQSSLPSTAQQDCKTHVENPPKQQRVSSLLSQPHRLPQPISPQHAPPQSCPQSDCNTDTRDSEEKCGLPVLESVLEPVLEPVLESVLEPITVSQDVAMFQEALLQSGGHTEVSSDAVAPVDVRRVDDDDDDVGLVGSPSLTPPMATDPPRSERGAEEGRCSSNTPVEEKLGGQPDAAEADAEVNQKGDIPPPNDETGESSQSKHRAEERPYGEIDYSFLASNKRYRSSFEWTAERRNVRSRNMQGVAEVKGQSYRDTSTPPTCQISPAPDAKTNMSFGFQERPSTFTIPTFLKGKENTKDPLLLSRAADLMPPPGIPASHKRDQRVEWNAIRETFSETSAEKEGRVPGSNNSWPSIPTTASPIGSRLWQDYPRSINPSLSHPALPPPSHPTSPPCPLTPCRGSVSSSPSHPTSARGSVSSPRHPLTPGSDPLTPGSDCGSEGFSPGSQDNEECQQSTIRAQIAKIEQFLCSERLRLPKRRKMDDS